ncbi:unnamed protein product, partial [Ectocarpus sp. 12 AP-2014]
MTASTPSSSSRIRTMSPWPSPTARASGHVRGWRAAAGCFAPAARRCLTAFTLLFVAASSSGVARARSARFSVAGAALTRRSIRSTLSPYSAAKSSAVPPSLFIEVA